MGPTRSSASLLLVITILGCGDSTEPSRRAIESSVTPEIAASLDAEGRFTLHPTVQVNGHDTVTLAQARALADAFVHQFWDAGLGEAITPAGQAVPGSSSLMSCGAPYLAGTALEPFPPDWDYISRRALGERWLFGFCRSGGDPIAQIGISVYATELRVTDGAIAFPPHHGEEFQWGRAGKDWDDALPLSPERAVVLAAHCTGRRIAGVPYLLLQPGYTPAFSKWVLPLEGSASLRTYAGQQLMRDTVYVGLHREPGTTTGDNGSVVTGLAVAAESQPDSFRFRRIEPFPDAFDSTFTETLPVVDAALARQLDQPTEFVPVECGR